MGDSTKLTERQQQVHNYLVALTSLYGVVTPKQFLLVFNRYNENKLLKAELMKYSNKLNNKFYYQGYFIYENFIVNTKISDEEINLIISYQQSKKYYNPTKEEIEAHISPTYYEKTEYTDRLKTFLLDNKVSILSIDQLMSDIVFAIKAEKRNQEVFDVLNKYNFEFKDVKSAQVFSKMLMDLHNNTRKWANCGMRPIEM